MKNNLLILILFIANLSVAQIAADSSEIYKTTVKTKFGTLTFNEFCKGGIATFSFHYLSFDYKTDEEAETNKILTDTVFIVLHIDADGFISDAFIVKPGKLENFTVLVQNLFEELKKEMKTQNQYFKCIVKPGKYRLPVKYTHN